MIDFEDVQRLDVDQDREFIMPSASSLQLFAIWPSIIVVCVTWEY
jgi:hypothetical protein